MKRLVIVFVILCANISIYGQLLGQIDKEGAAGMNDASGRIFFSWERDCDFFSCGENEFTVDFYLFGLFRVSDIGTTSIATPSTPGFKDFASTLTNGTDNILLHGINSTISPPACGKATYESRWINKHVESYGPDLIGYDITKISLTINNLTIRSPGQNPNGDGIWTDYTFDVTYNIYGEIVPEPATLMLFALGGMALRRRKGKIH